MKNIAVFLDRDNTINYDPGYLNDVEAVKLMPGVADGLANLKQQTNCKLIVISNQSGVARGLMTEDTVRKINERINTLLLSSHSVEIDDFFYCIYHPEFNDEEKSKCRKPNPRLVYQAAEKHNVDLSKSFFVGDAVSDVECGKNAGTKTVLLVYDESKSKLMKLKESNLIPDFIAENFNSACNYIIEDIKGKNN